MAGLQDNPTQQVICVDAMGKETGKTIDRKTAHTTPGVKHLAIQILVFNSKNELILHRRPMKKVGGGVLDAPTTHVLAGERPIESARRCLMNEYGIKDKQIPISVLKGYSYEKDYGDGSCENEYCLAAFVVYDGKIVPNKEEVVELANVPSGKVAEEIDSGKGNYPPWFKETVSCVREQRQKFFDDTQVWLF